MLFSGLTNRGRSLAAGAVAGMLLMSGVSGSATAWSGVASVAENLGGVSGVGFSGSENTTLSGKDQLIVVIDGAFNPTHPMLNGKVKEEACFGQYTPDLDLKYSTCSSDSAQWAEDPSIRFESGPGTSRVNLDCVFPDGRICHDVHGTAVASVAAGHKVVPTSSIGTVAGIAPDASLALLKIGDDDGWNLPGVVAALKYVENTLAAKYSVAAVNVSASLSEVKIDDSAPCPTSDFSVVAQRLKDMNIPVVVAAGNSSFSGASGLWSCSDSVVSVGSTNVSDPNTLVSGGLGTNASARVDLLAPVGTAEEGNSIRAAWSYRTSTSGATYENNYGSVTGTSFAAPQVAGAFAVLKQRFPTATVDTLTQLMQRTGVNVADTRQADTTGVVTPRVWLSAASGSRTAPVWDYTSDNRTDLPIIAADGRTLMLFPVNDSGTVDVATPTVVSTAWSGHTHTVPVHDYSAPNTNGFIASDEASSTTNLVYYAYDPVTNSLDSGTIIATDIGNNVVGASYVTGLPTIGTGTGLILQRDNGALELRTRTDQALTLDEAIPAVLPPDASVDSKLVGVADLNSDALPDLVVRDASTGTQRAYFGQRDPHAPFAETASSLTTVSYWTGKTQSAVVDGWTNVDGAPTTYAMYSVRPVNGNHVVFPTNADGTIGSTYATAATWVDGVRILHAARAD